MVFYPRFSESRRPVDTVLWQGLGRFGIGRLGGFLAWIRTGIPPKVRTLHDAVEVRISDTTAAVRLQGVRS